MTSETSEERVAYLTKMGTDRAKLQEETNDLSAKRQAYVENELKAMSTAERAKSFDHVVRQAVRSQAEGKGYRFETPETTSATDTPPATGTQGDAGDS